MLKSFTLLLSILFFFFHVSAQNETLVIISTSQGAIKVKLYNETPLHRDNFIRLVKEGKYNGSSFHNVIKNYSIQGGALSDEASRKPLPPEIVPGKFHKRGALCAAREDDVTNPEKLSSPTQFYIALGSVYQYELIDRIGARMNYVFSEEQKRTYSTIGGIPTLDGQNTVFGEVVEGMDVVEKISASPVMGITPVENISITMRLQE